MPTSCHTVRIAPNWALAQLHATRLRAPRYALCFVLAGAWGAEASAAQRSDRAVEYELTISEAAHGPNGSTTPALVVNGSIPGPTLRFTEGDLARITVRNALEDEETSIHWHGLLVPFEMDGVPYLTTPPIPPGESFVFEIPLRQSGTYWYHSHSGLQEQRGVYGGIVIESATPDGGRDVRDELVVLSDWTDESPEEVMRTLMRGSEWYSIRKGNQQTLYGAWRAGELGSFIRRERARMPAMDISDVAYDAFLANGEVHHRIDGTPGEQVRLRLVNAGASTYFYVTSGAGPLEVIAADGIDVEPVKVPRILMGIAETYDALVTIPEDGALEVMAVAQDGSGRARITIGRGTGTIPADPSMPNLYAMDDSVVGAIDASRTVVDPLALEADRPPTPYNVLRATESTELPTGAPVRELELRLTGDMTTYRWGINDLAFADAPLIGVREGEVVRIKFVNETMMHHPMHLHGHFFRVLTPQGERSPLKHTVDVPPMGTRTIEFLADEPGDWFLHCHILYHMDMGMARVVSYQAHDPEHTVQVDPKLYGQAWGFLDASLTTNMSMGSARIMYDRETFGLRWDVQLRKHGHAGSSEHAELERELDLFHSHLFDEDLRSILGYRFAEGDGTEDRFFAGVRYRLPYLIWSELTLDDDGDVRLAVERDLPLATRLDLDLRLQFDTETDGEAEAAIDYSLTKMLGLRLGWHSEHGAGIGVGISL